MSEKELVEFIETYKSLVVIPDTSLDSLFAAGLLMKRLINYGLDVRITLDAKFLVDYPSDPVVTIALPVISKQHLEINTNEDSSITGFVVRTLDKLMGIDKWDKVIAIIAGLYRGLYDFKQGGFKGIENTYLKELIQDKFVQEIAGLRLWGARRKDLVTALTRTLMPFIPGITGNPERASKLVSEVFKVQEPHTIRQKELRVEGDKDILLKLIKVIADSARDTHLAFKLIGDFYIYSRDIDYLSELEAHELIGSLVTYECLCAKCPIDVVIATWEKSLFSQILGIYDKVADRVAYIVSSQIDKSKTGEPVDLGGLLKRPDIVVDVLSYMNALPRNKTVKIISDKGYVTVLRELIRIGWKPEEAYALCNDDQLCQAR